MLMKIKELPWYDRPWTRLKKKGVSALSDAELLATVLGRGNRQENALDLSHRVLATHNYDKLSACSYPELETLFKNDIQAMKLVALFEINRRTNRLMRHGFSKKITNAEDVYNHFVDELSDKKKEHFYALLLDTKNRIIAEELVSVGILDASLIHPREVFKAAISANCRSMILVHNHPSGDCEPSGADKEVTKNLLEVGEILGIDVLDHVIVGKDNYMSMKECKMM